MAQLPRLLPSPAAPRPLVPLLALLLVAALGLTACGGDGDPVARLTVSPTELALPYGGFEDLTLEWQPEAALGSLVGQPRAFLHLVGEEGQLLRTFDHPLPRPWQPGTPQTYSARLYQSALAPPLPPGTYRLTAGLYDDGGNRWPLEVDGEAVGRQEYEVARVTVTQGAGELPDLSFVGSWSATAAGADRQVLATRWLSGNGALRLEGLGAPGTLWLEMEIPRAETLGGRLVLRRGGVGGPDEAAAAGESAEDGEVEAGQPAVRVTSTCGGFEATLAGEGPHRLEVPVRPRTGGRAGTPCAVQLRPNFFIAQEVSGAGQGAPERRAVLLQNLAWSGAAGGEGPGGTEPGAEAGSELEAGATAEE